MLRHRYGVKGGIDGAFMSTTTHREVAFSYAASATNGVGIVFEIAQGMVDRGADIGWLSQYPHEREIMFGPLTGLEVRSTRVDGAVLVMEMAISVNLASLTIEQVCRFLHLDTVHARTSRATPQPSRAVPAQAVFAQAVFADQAQAVFAV